MGHGVTEFDRVAVVGDKRTWHMENTFNVPEDAEVEVWAETAGFNRWSLEMRPVSIVHPSTKRYASATGGEGYWTRTQDIREVRYRMITRVTHDGSFPEEEFAIVSDQYNPIQPAEMVRTIASFAGLGDCSIETMGSLLGGREVWALLSLGSSWEVNGGRVEGYLLVTYSNDGTGAFKVRTTLIWVQCRNTLTMATRGKGSNKAGNLDFTQTHRTVFDPEKVRVSTGLARERFAQFRETAELLSQTHLSREEAYQYVARLSGSEKAWMTTLESVAVGEESSLINEILETAEMAEDLRTGKILVDPNKLNRIGSRVLERMLEGSPGARPLNGGISALDALHATTYYATNDKRIARTASGALDSALSGRANDLKNRGLELLTQMAASKQAVA